MRYSLSSNKIWRREFKIRANEIDLNNKIKIGSIFEYMQDAASENAEELGFGFDALKEFGSFWVLSWAKVEIENYPKFGDSIEIETWPKTTHRIFAMRDFIIYSGGEIICRATTGWLLLNAETKRPMRIESFPREIVKHPDKIALNEFPGKIEITGEKTNLGNRKIYYNDLDLNRHVNNAKYIEMLSNLFDEEKYNKNEIQSLEINYLAETKYGCKLEFSGNFNMKENSDTVEAVNIDDAKSVFKAKIKWRSI